MLCVVDVRYQIAILGDLHNHDLLARIPGLILVRRDLQETSSLNSHDDLLEAHAPLLFQLIIFPWIPVEWLHISP